MRALIPKEWMTLPRRAWSISIGIARRYPSSCLLSFKRSVIGGFFRRMAAGMDEHGALGIERVAGEHRMARLHLVPAEVGDDLGADRAHAHAGEQRKREG